LINDDGNDVEDLTSYIPKRPLSIVGLDISPDLEKIILDEFSSIPTLATHKIPHPENNKIFIDITHARATKQLGVFELAKILDIETHEIIGVGDGHNDFPMLMACGLKVAMGNAVDDLKAIADYIAPTVDNDGVADVIEKFVL
jgi:hydroxymethylpyrimidine pyrophosphatase-like HAD family hydrolase